MKHKSSKRAICNKQYPRDSTSETQTRRFSSSSTPIVSNRRRSTDQGDLETSTLQLDSRNACFKANLTLKSQKLLKRDLLRCSDQRPTFLASQILPKPRIEHPSLHKRSTESSSVDRLQTIRRRSLSVNTGHSYHGVDRIGPWPDTSIGRLRSDGAEFLQPLKICHSLKKPRVGSPKSCRKLHSRVPQAERLSIGNDCKMSRQASIGFEHRTGWGALLDSRGEYEHC
jgi:hypothetical protein